MSITANLKKIKEKIQNALETENRKNQVIKLVAVSKGRSSDALLEAIQAGQMDFGENYLQEALTKIAALKDYPLQWHFIGPIQSNKARFVAENFSWVHTVARKKIAQRLNDSRPAELPPLNVCVQINISQEVTKSGLMVEELADFLQCFKSLPRLHLRGLMVIPEVMKDDQRQLAMYQRVSAIFLDLKKRGWPLDTLSMGMSDDFVVAIAAGSTLVRVGRAIFEGE